MFSQNSLVSKFDTNLLGHVMPKVLSSFFFFDMFDSYFQQIQQFSNNLSQLYSTVGF